MMGTKRGQFVLRRTFDFLKSEDTGACNKDCTSLDFSEKHLLYSTSPFAYGMCVSTPHHSETAQLIGSVVTCLFQ